MVEHCKWRYDFDLMEHQLVRVRPGDEPGMHYEKVIAVIRYDDSPRWRRQPWYGFVLEEPLKAYNAPWSDHGSTLERAKRWCEFVLGEITE